MESSAAFTVSVEAALANECDVEDIQFYVLDNGADRNGKFDAFWEARHIIEPYQAPDDRRHGDMMHLNAVISIRDLHQRAKQYWYLSDRGLESSSIPSEEYLRLQFHPSNVYSLSAERYRLRFSMKFKMQVYIQHD